MVAVLGPGPIRGKTMVNRSTMGIDGDTEDTGQRTIVTIPIDHIVPSMG
jgi:hypothetical protein